MTGRPTLSPMSDDESLARFILRQNQIRSDQTVKPDAFIPYPWPDLSVTRHLGLTDDELWERTGDRGYTSSDLVRTSRRPSENLLRAIAYSVPD